jgi:hypothetical protein
MPAGVPLRSCRSRARFRCFVLGALCAIPLLALGAAASAAAGADPDLAPSPPGAGVSDWPARLATLSARSAERPPLAGPAGVETYGFDQTGGDDVSVATLTDLNPWVGPSLDVADNGDEYAAIEVDASGAGKVIRVYRSLDHGKSWSLWGSLGTGDPAVSYSRPWLHIAEGTVSRVYVACRYSAGGVNSIRVAYCALGAASAAWTERVAMTSASDSYVTCSLASDEATTAAFTLFLVAGGDDSNGNDIWFTRSTDLGNSWEAAYELASLSSGDRGYFDPCVTYGSGGVVHVAYWFYPYSVAGLDPAVRYRRALNRAASGLSDWQSPVYLTPNADGRLELYPTVAASPIDGKVLVTYELAMGTTLPSKLHLSSDNGASWAAADTALTEGYDAAVVAKPNGGFGLMSVYTGDDWGVQSSASAAPLALSDWQSLMDRYHFDSYYPYLANQVAVDPTRGNRLAIAWTCIGATTDTLFWDAEWRRDPGYPNLEKGFPQALPFDVVSPPAVCELDPDQPMEIVFGDVQGYVRAYNHNGTVLTGWPQKVDGLDLDEAIAVGDLDVDGHNEVVVGSNVGKIYVFRDDGSLAPGWPLDTGTGWPAYVSLGPIVPNGQRQVVAVTKNKVHLLDYACAEQPGFPLTTGSNFYCSAAIGDVDADGYTEIVILQSIGMDVLRYDGYVKAYNLPPEKTFNRPPTLGDLDQDGKLEIVAPSTAGDVYVWKYDGTPFAGWPVTLASGNAVSSVALSQFRSSFDLELLWTEISAAQPKVHAYFRDGSVASGFPQPMTVGWWGYAQPITDMLAESQPDVVVGSRGDSAFAWTNFGVLLPEWPMALTGKCEVSAADGDLDQDGNVELVFCTTQPPGWSIVDMGASLLRDPGYRAWWWPMYQYNPQRQGCQWCGLERVSGVGGGAAAIARVVFAAPRPNPGAEVTFEFQLPERAAVKLTVVDVAGRAVRELMKSEQPPGSYRAAWNGVDGEGHRLPAGIYYALLRVAGPSGVETIARKVTLLR